MHIIVEGGHSLKSGSLDVFDSVNHSREFRPNEYTWFAIDGFEFERNHQAF